MAAGRRAKAVNTGSFVWADSTNADFTSTADNQFSIRATNGVVVVDVVAGSPADQAGLQPQDVITAIDGQQLQGESALAESMYGRLSAQVDEFLHADTTSLPDPQAMGYGAVNALFG